MDPEQPEAVTEHFEKGFAKAGNGKSIKDFDIAPTVAVVLGDDVKACMLPLKAQLALYIGGMGAREKNFYNEYARRIGFTEQALKVQDLFLTGKKNEAIAAVPDELVDALYLVGPKARIRERFQRWKKAPIGTFMVGSADMEVIRLMAELAEEQT
jgi:alkanesulfonate monooxygenase SsuD/methylene tetrahydromethanopterin reductase-like flavin-dependent oxidoreductase (luciferase family)